MNNTCDDFELLGKFPVPEKPVCETCVTTNSRWVHLRTCMSCGQTLCCDSSPNKHMTNHYHDTKHPVIISAEPGEKWIFCYTHNTFKQY